MEIDKILNKKKGKVTVQDMYLAPKKLCKKTIMFDVPHKPEPMSAYEIAKKFPKFANEMDGSSEDNSLSFFYKKNKETHIYEFVDEEAEQEAAEMMGVEVYDESKQDEPKGDTYEARELTPEEHQVFREHIADIREKLQHFK